MSAASEATAGVAAGHVKSGDVHPCQRTRVTDPNDTLLMHECQPLPCEARAAFTSANVRATRALRKRAPRTAEPVTVTVALPSERSAISQPAVFVDPPLTT